MALSPSSYVHESLENAYLHENRCMNSHKRFKAWETSLHAHSQALSLLPPPLNPPLKKKPFITVKYFSMSRKMENTKSYPRLTPLSPLIILNFSVTSPSKTWIGDLQLGNQTHQVSTRLQSSRLCTKWNGQCWRCCFLFVCFITSCGSPNNCYFLCI